MGAASGEWSKSLWFLLLPPRLLWVPRVKTRGGFPACPLTGTTVSRLRETIWGLEMEWQEVSDLWQEINFKLEMWAEGCSVPTAVKDIFNCCRFLYICLWWKCLKYWGNYTFLRWLEGLFEANRYVVRVHFWRFNWAVDKLRTYI